MNLESKDISSLIQFAIQDIKAAELLGELAWSGFETGSLEIENKGARPPSLPSSVAEIGTIIKFNNKGTLEFFIAFRFAQKYGHYDIPATLVKLNDLNFGNNYKLKPEFIDEYYFIIMNRVYNLSMLSFFQLEGRYFFSINDTFNKAFEFLTLPINDFIEILKIVAVKTENDLEGGATYKLIEKIPDFNIGYAKELFEFLLEPSRLAIVRYLPSLMAGLSKHLGIAAFHDKSIELLSSSHQEQVVSAILGINVLPYESESKNVELAYNALLEKTADPSDQVRAQAVQAICSLKIKLPFVQTKLTEFAKSPDVMLRVPIAHYIWQQSSKEAPSAELQTLALLLPVAPTEHKGLLEYVNWHIVDSFNLGLQKYAFELFRAWVKTGQSTKSFEHVISKFKSDLNSFSTEITNWFNSADRMLLNSLTNLTGAFEHYNFRLDVETLNSFSDEEMKRVIGAVPGFVFSSKPLASLTVSILDSKHAQKQSGNIVAILSDYICYTYPSTIDELIKPELKKSKGIKKKVLAEVIKQTDSYFNNLRDLPISNEFGGSELRVSSYFKATQQKQETLMSAARGKSFFSSYAKNVSLRTAEVWFTKTKEGYSEERRLERMEYAFELPRAEYIDPANFEFFRHRMRVQSMQA